MILTAVCVLSTAMSARGQSMTPGGLALLLGPAGICNLQMEIKAKILLEDELKMRLRLSEKAAEDTK